MENRTKIILAFAGVVIIGAVLFLRDVGVKSPDETSTDSRASSDSKPQLTDPSQGVPTSTSVDAPTGHQPESSQLSTSQDASQQSTAQQATGSVSVSTDAQGDGQTDAPQPVITPPPAQRTFKGIKQSNNNVMVSEIKYAPGDLEDGFVATFQSADGAKGFDANVWIIGDYVQRGTTGIMAMPSHSELNLSADGSPSNPKGGLRVAFSGGRTESVSRKFSIKRPGFDGEELSQIRIGIYDRSTGKVHIAKVSAAELAKKRSTKRVRVDGAN